MFIKTVSRRLKNAWHNIVIHPIVGVLYLLGFEKTGDWLHGEGPRVEDLPCPECQSRHAAESAAVVRWLDKAANL